MKRKEKGTTMSDSVLYAPTCKVRSLPLVHVHVVMGGEVA